MLMRAMGTLPASAEGEEVWDSSLLMMKIVIWHAQQRNPQCRGGWAIGQVPLCHDMGIAAVVASLDQIGLLS